MPWPGCCRSRPRSPSAGFTSAIAARGFSPTGRWDRPASRIMGHEFHYASVLQAGDEPLVDCRDATGAVVPEAGARRGSVSGTFFHAIDGLQDMKPSFDAAFRAQFRDLVLWRRDVRRFRRDPVPRERIDALIEIATHAPSVGLSQPWRFVHVEFARAAAGRHQELHRCQRTRPGRLLRREAGDLCRPEAGRPQGGAGSPRGASPTMARIPAAGLASRPCPRRCTIPSSPRSRPCGWRRAPTASAWAGCRSSIPAAVTKRARRAEVVEPRGLSLPRASGRGASRSRARAASLGAAHGPEGRRVHTLDALDAFHTGCHLAAVVPARDQKGTRCMCLHITPRLPPQL